MKLKDLKCVLHSTKGYIQMAVIFDSKKAADIATGSIDFLVSNYGEAEVERIEAFENHLVITV